MPQRRSPADSLRGASISAAAPAPPLADAGLPWQSSGLGDILWRGVKALGLDDPLSIGQGSQQPASVGGLPDGLNPEAIRLLLKQMNLDVPTVAPAAAVETGVKRVAPKLSGALRDTLSNDSRMAELLAKFGGSAK